MVFDSPGALGRLTDFRRRFHACLRPWGDALFELADAALGAAGPVSSLPALSLEAPHRRSHGSLYKALRLGGVDAEGVKDLLCEHRPQGWAPVFAVDESTWPRCDAETSPGRGFHHSASRHSNGKPIVAGWSYQWVAQLSWANDSWTAPMDARRIAPDEDRVAVTVEQVLGLAGRLGADGDVPAFVFDAGYDPAALTWALAGARAQIVVRIRDDRVFHHDPPPRPPGAKGRPARHGARFACADPATWPAPDHQAEADDPRYGRVRVQAWDHLHPKLAGRGRWAGGAPPPIIRATVVRVDVEHLPKQASRHKKTLWLWHAGPGFDIDLAWRAYLRRFDIEHTFRLAKRTLGWTTPAIRTPEQADRWTWLILAAHTQLRLARGLIADHRMKWERPRPPGKLTPNRVRRGFHQLAPTIGTPASPPKPSQPGPGRPKGTNRPPRTRHPAIKRTRPKV
jgi:hypothetical protein